MTEIVTIEKKRDGRGRWVKGCQGGPGPRPSDKHIDRMYLAGAIRDMLENEVDEETGRVKLLELIHVAYGKAKEADSDMMKLLFERGYGKTPATYQLDPRILLEQLCVQHGLTIEDIKSDPIANYFFGLLDGNGTGETGAIAPPRGTEEAERPESEQPVLEPD